MRDRKKRREVKGESEMTGRIQKREREREETTVRERKEEIGERRKEVFGR